MEENIAEVEEWLGERLPRGYIEFLNGHSEQICGANVFLYPVDALIERNTTFEVKTYCAGYLAIGDDSGGSAFVIPLKNWDGGVYIVDQGDMAPDSFRLVTKNFKEWTENGCPHFEADA